MAMLNDIDRFHLAIEAIDRVPGLAERAGHVRQQFQDARLKARQYTREFGQDDPEISGWVWPY
jgi:xylulose-5-phosphate/fructose-6-phosphate phosphoketolase